MPSYWTTELRRNYWLRSMHWAGRYVSKLLLFFSASDWALLVLLRCCWVRPVSCVSEVNAPPYRYTLFRKHSSKSYGLTIKSFILLLRVALTFKRDKIVAMIFEMMIMVLPIFLFSELLGEWVNQFWKMNMVP